MLVNATSYDSSGEAVCFNQFSIYIGGAGGFGGKKRSEHAKPLVTMPTRAPDASVKEKTSCCQAAIYRLSGDSNPIHIDPDFAQMGGTVRLLSYRYLMYDGREGFNIFSCPFRLSNSLIQSTLV